MRTSGDADVVALLGSERDGGFAEAVTVDVAQVHDVSGSPLRDAELACLPIAYGTATGVLNRGRARSGECVVVTGASGGVGIDLVADVVAGELFTPWPGLVSRRGRIVVAGAIAGPVVPLDLRQLYLQQRMIIGSTMHPR